MYTVFGSGEVDRMAAEIDVDVLGIVRNMMLERERERERERELISMKFACIGFGLVGNHCF